MKGHKLLYGASILMVLAFCVNLIVDWQRYNTTLNSAPFWIWILCDAALWLPLALVAFTAGFVAKRKLTKKEKTK